MLFTPPIHSYDFVETPAKVVEALRPPPGVTSIRERRDDHPGPEFRLIGSVSAVDALTPIWLALMFRPPPKNVTP